MHQKAFLLTKVGFLTNEGKICKVPELQSSKVEEEEEL